jgi:peroxiredoxin
VHVELATVSMEGMTPFNINRFIKYYAMNDIIFLTAFERP